MTDSVLNKETWREEAQAAIGDIERHVKHASVSNSLPNSNQRIYLNLTTLENASYCIEMSAAGFKIVGREHDHISVANIDDMIYETPYALLNTISQKYRESFGGELMSKLLELAKKAEG